MLILRVIGLVFERKDVMRKFENGIELTKSEHAVLNISLFDTFTYCLFNITLICEFFFLIIILE
jgi:hypothetical protein